VNQERLEAKLSAAFDGDETTVAVVARLARDLADSGRLQADLGVQVTATAVVSHLEDAPDGHSLVERWNWWVGSLELSHGGYRRFRARREFEDNR